ncbi:MAG: hypothetical protein ACI4O7_15530 [Aristaeellaceae bacterium]
MSEAFRTSSAFEVRMMRWMLARGAAGMLTGIAMHQLCSLLMSYALNLGYYAPCIAGLGERFGGELNAAAVQLLCAAMLGMAAGVAAGLIGRRRKKAAPGQRRLDGPDDPGRAAGNTRAASPARGKTPVRRGAQRPRLRRRAGRARG